MRSAIKSLPTFGIMSVGSQSRRGKAAAYCWHHLVDQTLLERRAAEGPADERCHHRLSQCRAPLSPNQMCEKLWTLPTDGAPQIRHQNYVVSGRPIGGDGVSPEVRDTSGHAGFLNISSGGINRLWEVEDCSGKLRIGGAERETESTASYRRRRRYGRYRESILAIHVPSRNKLAGPRVLALQQEIRKSAAVAVRAMSVVQIVTRRRAVGSPVCHRHPARRAQLPPLCHHAFRGLRHV
jgi:hypothetical protein